MKLFHYRVAVVCLVIDVLVIKGESNIRCNFTRVWGPGLDPLNIIMPARYFFLETVDEKGNKFNKSVGENIFTVEVFGSENACRVRGDLLDRHDGSFIFRYKLYSTCSQAIISVKCLGDELPGFPIHFKENIYPDECVCSVHENIEQWLHKYGCTKSFERINLDLKVFENIDFDDIFPVAQENLFNNPNKHSVCNYAIKNNQIYRKCYGQYTGFKMFSDAILLLITRKVRLPDIEILMNLGDWPLVKHQVDYNGKKVLLPVFSWCGSADTFDISLPTYDITESSLENLGRVTLDMLSIQANTGPQWEEKISKLFWRGRDSSRERLKLISIGRQYGHLMNVSLTNFFFFKDLEAQYGPAEKRVSFFEFFNYKYQMNMDGTVAAYRFPYLLAGNSLIFKQNSSYYEHYYGELQEWKHFVPVKKDLSDLIEKLNWAVKHETEAQNIVFNAQDYARNRLLPQDIFCYHVQLLYAYSKKQKQPNVKLRPDMELVKQNNKTDCQCQPSTIEIRARDLHEDL